MVIFSYIVQVSVLFLVNITQFVGGLLLMILPFLNSFGSIASVNTLFTLNMGNYY